MRDEESLRYLHHNWALPDHYSGRAPVSGSRAKGLLRRVAARAVFGAMGEYLAAERELVSNLVRLCDALAKRADALEQDIETLTGAVGRELGDLAAHLEDRERIDGARRGADGD